MQRHIFLWDLLCLPRCSVRQQPCINFTSTIGRGRDREFSRILASSVFSSALETRVQTLRGPCRHPRCSVSCKYDQEKMRRALQPLNQHHVVLQKRVLCRAVCWELRVQEHSLGARSQHKRQLTPSHCGRHGLLLLLLLQSALHVYCMPSKFRQVVIFNMHELSWPYLAEFPKPCLYW